MDMLWTCYGHVMDMLWTGLEHVMSVSWTACGHEIGHAQQGDATMPDPTNMMKE